MALNEKKLITALTGVLAVLAIVVLLVLSSRYRDHKKADPAPGGSILATEEGSGDYTSLTYFNGSTTLAFHRSENGKWIWSDDYSVAKYMITCQNNGSVIIKILFLNPSY